VNSVRKSVTIGDEVVVPMVTAI